MSFRRKLFILIICLCITPLAAVGAYMFTTGKESLRQASFDELRAVNQLSAGILDQWIQQSATLIDSLAQRPLLINAVAELKSPSPDQSQRIRTRTDLITAHLAPALAMQDNLESFSILDSDSGLIIFSTDPQLEGKYRGEADFFLQGLKGPFVGSVLHSVSLGTTVMHVSTPIKDSKGNTLAVLSGHVRWAKASQILAAAHQQSETMESYLVNRFHYMVTDSRFTPNSAMRLFISTEGSNACFEKGGGQSVYKDYRDVRVLGVYKGFPERGLCLMTEKNESEVLAQVLSLKQQVFGIIFMISLVAVLLVWWTANSMTRPIAALVRGAQSFGRGKLDHRIPESDGELGTVSEALNDMALNLAMITASRDDLNTEMTQRKAVEKRLKKRTMALQQSNRDLEQFAYAASHDLQEPLRIISGYLQLIEKRYGDQLDADAHEFIDFTVDASKRMQTLINDLLNYSRIGRKDKNLGPVDMNQALETATSQQRLLIAETSAKINYTDLPVVTGNNALLVQLFQNLVGNAVKFRSEEQPIITVTAQEQDQEWLFAVKDNGIGIEPEFLERIFQIFQRLHTRQEYPGTGIGLALCQRIANFHGGHIWVESTFGQGSTFYFTLAKNHDS